MGGTNNYMTTALVGEFIRLPLRAKATSGVTPEHNSPTPLMVMHEIDYAQRGEAHFLLIARRLQTLPVVVVTRRGSSGNFINVVR